MSVSLAKGSTISLKKTENDLSRVTIGLGWDVAEPKQGLLGKLFAGPQEEYDLDVIAVLLDANRKIADIGDRLKGGDVVFFNSMEHPSGCMTLTGDNRTGAGDGDDEQILCDLDRLPTRYQHIAFIVQIYKGEERGQHFGVVANAFIRAENARGTEMLRFSISNSPDYRGARSLIFAEMHRSPEGWSFEAIGRPFATDSFVEVIQRNYI